jgi:tetratricopeptide (TPR) repeat protein
MRSLLLLVLLAAVSAVYFGAWGMRYGESGAYRAASAYVEANEQVRARLGDDVEVSPLALGWFDEAEGEASLGLTARSEQGSVALLLELTELSDVWHVTAARIEGEDEAAAGADGAQEADATDLSAVDEQTLTHAASRTAGGYALFQRDMLDEAVEELTLGIDTDSTYVDAWFWRSQVLMARGDTLPSLEDLEVVVQLDPNRMEALSYLGRAYYVLGDLGRAIPYLERAAAIDARWPGVVQTLNRARQELAEQGGAAGEVTR